MAKQSTLSAGERSQLVLRLLSKEEPAAQIARRAGVSEQSLYRWRDEFLSAGRQALAGRGADREQAKELREVKSALAERDQVIHHAAVWSFRHARQRAGAGRGLPLAFRQDRRACAGDAGCGTRGPACRMLEAVDLRSG
jgi:transposase-like protein